MIYTLLCAHVANDSLLSFESERSVFPGEFTLNLELCDRVLVEMSEAIIGPRTMRLKITKVNQGVIWKSLQKPHIPKPAQVNASFSNLDSSSGNGMQHISVILLTSVAFHGTGEEGLRLYGQ
jgi:hypothetical protein